jgi:hypothetical protein
LTSAQARRWVAPTAILAALALLLLNDWWLKPAGGFWVGKVSDLAGLFLVPLPIFGARRALWPLLGARAFPLVVCAAVAVVFVLVKTNRSGAVLAAQWWPWPQIWGAPRVVCDPTDLLALAALPPGYVAARALWH